MVKTSSIEEYKLPVILVGGSVIISLLLVLLLGRPLWNGMQQKKIEVKSKREVLAVLEEKLENLKKLESRKEELKEKNAKVLAALPTNKDVARLFVQFENAATQSGVTVKQVSESGDAETNQQSSVVNKLVYQVTSTTGGYSALKTALSKFETALRLLSISEMDLTSSETQLLGNLKVTTFVRGEE